MITGALFDRTYRSGESFEPASLDERDMQYLYQDETGYVFMDQKTYEQATIDGEVLGAEPDQGVEHRLIDALIILSILKLLF